MSKYHVNPETGNPGKCTAPAGKCPFASDNEHYTSREAAAAHYEERVANDSDPSTNEFGEFSKKAKTPTSPDTAIAGLWDTGVAPFSLAQMNAGTIFYSKANNAGFEVLKTNNNIPGSENWKAELVELDANDVPTKNIVEVTENNLKKFGFTQLQSRGNGTTDESFYKHIGTRYVEEMKDDAAYLQRGVRGVMTAPHRELKKAEDERFDKLAKSLGNPTKAEIWDKYNTKEAKGFVKAYEKRVKNPMAAGDTEVEHWQKMFRMAQVANTYAKRTGHTELITQSQKIYDDSVVKAFPESEDGAAVIARRKAAGEPTGELTKSLGARLGSLFRR